MVVWEFPCESRTSPESYTRKASVSDWGFFLLVTNANELLLCLMKRYGPSASRGYATWLMSADVSVCVVIFLFSGLMITSDDKVSDTPELIGIFFDLIHQSIGLINVVSRFGFGTI